MLDEAKGLLNETLGILVGAGVEIERKATAYERMSRVLAKKIATHLVADHGVVERCSAITLRLMGAQLKVENREAVLSEIIDEISPHVERHAKIAKAQATDLFDEMVVLVFEHLQLEYIADELRLMVLQKLQDER